MKLIFQQGAEGRGGLPVGQQGQGVSQGRAGVKEQGQGATQAADLIAGQFMCFHKDPTSMYAVFYADIPKVQNVGTPAPVGSGAISKNILGRNWSRRRYRP